MNHFKSEATISCGCHTSLRPKKDLTGQEINGVLFVGYEKSSFWRVKFSCGHTSSVKSSQTKLTKTGKCRPCSVRNILIDRNTSHGMSKEPTYLSWLAMRRRCRDETNNRYEYYGGRGVEVCDRWEPDKGGSFENFNTDMGARPDGFSIERDNLELGYSPGNCRWASVVEQANNKSNNILIENSDGVTWSLRRWCMILGKDYKSCWSSFRNKGGFIENILGPQYKLIKS